MKRVLNLCLQMKRSIIAFFATIVIGLLSMGLLGLLLYEAVHPVLGPFFSDLDDWHGDTVWPVIIVAGMGWSVSFIAAGLINMRLETAGWKKQGRRVIYGLVLWLGAALIWFIILSAHESG